MTQPDLAIARIVSIQLQPIQVQEQRRFLVFILIVQLLKELSISSRSTVFMQI
jgi:hypothetical protein